MFTPRRSARSTHCDGDHSNEAQVANMVNLMQPGIIMQDKVVVGTLVLAAEEKCYM